MEREYEFEVWQNDTCQASGSTPHPRLAQYEAGRYARIYGRDGPVIVRFYMRQSVTQADLEAAAASVAIGDKE